MYLGIDIGSSSSKVAIINDNKEIVALSIVNLGTGTNAHETVVANAIKEANISKDDIKFTVATGYGRVGYKDADRQVTEISCHAKGVVFLDPDANTIVDIGGQDAKVIKLTRNGQVENFVMNEKCAAGTGRFMEVMARVLGCSLNDLSPLADNSTKALSINNVCTVFAESEVISRLAAGESNSDVARGANVAIAKRVAGMCNRVGYGGKVVMTGGVALSPNFVDALSIELKTPVHVVQHCQGVGALGAAIFAYEMYNK